jgi:glutathione S-transferase
VILVGQYDSPFVRRVAITLHHYGVAFTRDPVSVFSPDIVRFHPLMRVPALVLDDGEILWDSGAILDHLDEQVPPEVALVPRAGAARRRVLRAMTLATGAIDKVNALVFEHHMHAAQCLSAEWIDRCRRQLEGALVRLDGDAGAPWVFGETMTQADVTIGCLVAYVRLRLGEALPAGRYPALDALAARCEASEPFRRAVPAPDEALPATGTVRR